MRLVGSREGAEKCAIFRLGPGRVLRSVSHLDTASCQFIQRNGISVSEYESGGMILTGKSAVLGETSVPVALFIPKISHGLTWGRIQVSAVRVLRKILIFREEVTRWWRK